MRSPLKGLFDKYTEDERRLHGAGGQLDLKGNSGCVFGLIFFFFSVLAV